MRVMSQCPTLQSLRFGEMLGSSQPDEEFGYCERPILRGGGER